MNQNKLQFLKKDIAQAIDFVEDLNQIIDYDIDNEKYEQIKSYLLQKREAKNDWDIIGKSDSIIAIENSIINIRQKNTFPIQIGIEEEDISTASESEIETNLDNQLTADESENWVFTEKIEPKTIITAKPGAIMNGKPTTIIQFNKNEITKSVQIEGNFTTKDINDPINAAFVEYLLNMFEL